MTVVGTQGARPQAPAPPGIATRRSKFFADTPGRMRVLRLLSIAAALIFAFGASGAVRAQRDALGVARDNAEQLVRIGVVRTSLVEADAVATNTFLQGGLERTGLRQRYDAALERASFNVADAAGHDGTDAVALRTVNAQFAKYAGLIEAARSTNRVGLPVGAAYLNQASSMVRDEILPELGRISARHEAKVNDRYDALSSIVVSVRVATVIGIGVLTVVLVWLALRTRRFLNLPYAVGAMALVFATLASAVTVRSAQKSANATYRTDYAETLSLVQARANAFDAKSAESLTLISRGSGAPFEVRFRQLIADALRQSGGAGTADAANALVALSDFESAHVGIRTLDDRGNWDRAVALATATGRGSPSASFDSFAGANQRAIDRSSRALTDTLGDDVSKINTSVWVLLVGGLLAAVLALVGMSARLREFA